MNQITALAWKEWRESRWSLIVGLGVFLILPLIGAIENLAAFGRFELSTLPAVVLLGSLLAIFTAVAATCRDLRPGLEDFWRSRPAGVFSWLLSKYTVGLAMVLCACCVPLAIDIALTPARKDTTGELTVLKWFPFIWLALYSIAFAAGCAVRRISHATMLSLAAMLLLYFVPVLIPPAKLLSMRFLMDEDSDVSNSNPRHLAVAMVCISAMAFCVSLLLVSRQWKVESGPKMVYGSIGLSLLLLLVSAAYPLAKNLPLQDQVTVPHTIDAIETLYTDGKSGVLIGHEARWDTKVVIPFRITESRIELMPEITIPPEMIYRSALPLEELRGIRTAWMPEQPQFVFFVYPRSVSDSGRFTYSVAAIDLDHSGEPIVPKRVYEGAGETRWIGNNWFDPHVIYAHAQRIYLNGPDSKIIVIDVSTPSEPKFAFLDHWTLPPPRMGGVDNSPDRNFHVSRPASMSESEALEFFRSQNRGMDGTVLCLFGNGGIATFRQAINERGIMRYAPAGRLDATFLEQLAGEFRFSGNSLAKNGLAYGLAYNGVGGLGFHLTVFDIHDPAHPRRAGHFAVPSLHVGFANPAVLPDGRIIVPGYRELYLVGAPRHSRE